MSCGNERSSTVDTFRYMTAVNAIMMECADVKGDKHRNPGTTGRNARGARSAVRVSIERENPQYSYSLIPIYDVFKHT